MKIKNILLFLIIFFITLKAFAHPLDISMTSGTFKGNELRLTTYFHSYEIEYLLNKNDKFFKSTYDYYKYSDIILSYLKNNIFIKLENNNCELRNFELLEQEEYQILTYGLEMNYILKCEKNIDKGNILITFFSNFPLQTNQLTLYDGNIENGGDYNKSFVNIILNNDYNDFSFDLKNKTTLCKVDTDGDGLTDETELLYKTDPENIDTDGDFFTDFEEVTNSFSPLDINPGPNQGLREEIPDSVLQKVSETKVTQKDCDKIIKKSSDLKSGNGILSYGFGNEYFAKTLETIGKYLYDESEMSIFFILLIIVGLGFIHAAGPGHSKSLLVSYIIDKNKTYFDGFVFVLIFTITHLIDIVILFVFTKIIFGIYDISKYMLIIQRVSLIILFIFSIFLIYRGIKNYKSNNIECEKSKTSDKKSSIFLGFVSGLAPCTFGWSIFFLLFSIGNFGLVIPMLLALGFGIFLFLFMILTLTYFLRVKFFSKVEFLSKISSLLSSVILLVISIFLLTKVF